MIFGSYPCCGGHLTQMMPDQTPAYAKEICPHCGATVWHRFSRVESMSWTEADFLEEHTVNLEARTIEPRPGTKAEQFDRVNRRLFYVCKWWNAAGSEFESSKFLAGTLKETTPDSSRSYSRAG